MTSLSAAIGKQFIMLEKHFPSLISAGDFFGETGTTSALAKFDVSLFSLESMKTSRLSSEDCEVVDDVMLDVVVVSSDESASAIFSRSLLLSQSYICTREESFALKASNYRSIN